MRHHFRLIILAGAVLIIIGALGLIFIVQAIDGSGTNTVSPTSTTVDSTGNTFTFTFTAAETMNSGEISVNVPSGWSAPQGSSGTAGHTTVTSSSGVIANVEDNGDSTAGWSAGTACTNGLSADTATKQEGTAAIKCANGNEANNDRWYKNVTAENWSSYTKIAFWINSSVAVTAGRLNFAYDDSANLASPIEEISVGALSANTWTYLVLTFGPTTRTAVTSFGFVIKHPAALDNSIVRVDDILIGPGLPTFPGGGDIRARLLQLSNTQTVTLTYGSGGGASGATAPSIAGTYTFTTKSRVSDAGALTAITSSPTVNVNNPAPTTTSISPTSKTAGDPGFTMTVNGTNFVTSSVVRFDGSDRTTTFVNSTQLTASIPSSDLTTAGTFSITVFNPAPGGGTSNDQTFTVNALAGDTTAPAAITDLALSDPTTSSIKLTWTAPGDDGSTGTATSYDIRYSTSVINDGNFAAATQVTGEPAPQVAGTAQTMTVTGLSANTTYFFAMKTADEVPNTSNLSNVPSLSTSAPSGDTTAPAAITDLALSSPTTNSMIVSWTAPGDDGNTGTASSYDLRYSDVPITDSSFLSATQVAGEPAPQVAGTAQSMTVSDLLANTTHYFAMKTSDEVPNTSAISNVPSLSTLSEILSPIVIPPPSSGGVLPTNIVFSGKAYPNSRVLFFRRSLIDALTRNTFVLDTEMIADNNGEFQKQFQALLQGEYFFAVEAKDKNGRSSGIISFKADLISSNELKAENILVPPTIDFEATTVSRGKDLKVLGYASPNNRVEAIIDNILKYSTASNSSGYYALTVNTSRFSAKDHFIKARQIYTDGISQLSPIRTFKVSLLAYPQADFNGDGTINITDWSIFLVRWRSKDLETKKFIDLDLNNKIDIGDFSVFLKAIRGG